MANLKPALTPEEVKKAGVTNIRTAYNNLADTYTKMLDRELIMCPSCGEYMKADTAFYMDKKYATNRFPICKRCILKMVEQRKTDRDEPNETKESVQKVLQLMDKVYDDYFYDDCIKGATDGVKEKNRTSPFATYITAISSLPQWKGKTWADSDFGESGNTTSEEEFRINEKTIRAAKKRFGMGYSNEDLMFLENQYQDWVTRYECNSKAQEEIFERLSFKKLEINKATKAGQPTKDLDKTYQDWLGTANIQPRQSGMDTLADAQTFGTLLKKYEETRPLPDIDPELEDVDKIGTYIDVFFKGHLSKSFGLKNNFSHIYEKYIKQFTVNKPQYDEEADSEVLFDKIFGSSEE